MSERFSQRMQELWEQAVPQAPALRALTLLRLGEPDAAMEELANLPVGERDRRLLAVRERCLGSQFEANAICPGCGARSELLFACDDLRADSAGSYEPLQVVYGDWTVRARVPSTADLLAVARPSAEAADALLARCILGVERAGERVAPDALPTDVATAVETAIANADPLGDISFDATCPSCGHDHTLSFDVVGYLWQEVDARVERLLRDVHQLARAYGWAEADILALSDLRRRRYLELLAEA